MKQRGPSIGLIVGLACVALFASSCSLFGIDLGIDGVDARTVEVDNQNGRTALLVESTDRVASDGPGPAVLILHGLGEDAEGMARLATWPEAARDNGFLAVFPQGVDDSWNAGRCCGDASAQEVDDMAFLDALIAQLVAEENVDPDQIYLTGFSNGAMMTYLYACRRPDAVVGAASVAGTNFSDCKPGAPVEFIQISGSEDPVIPVLGGKSSLPGLPKVPSVEDSVLAFARASGCSGEPTGFELDGVASFQGENCDENKLVRYDVVGGLGHKYPNLVNSPNYVAVDKILEFWGLPADK